MTISPCRECLTGITDFPCHEQDRIEELLLQFSVVPNMKYSSLQKYKEMAQLADQDCQDIIETGHFRVVWDATPRSLNTPRDVPVDPQWSQTSSTGL